MFNRMIKLEAFTLYVNNIFSSCPEGWNLLSER